ncbi:hypothetical protein K466DRAFT_517240 [Polyporus arcularius HHB13444]|uniref:DASH complex subunit DAD2 n=1 Tax=Polyporus arcularius HHB13444 TaxID=1314778 RepID=A0A5C3PRD1_9APHY|nr:hypothetical protein K466DRAFT_517240 [Polyporus arcularius HHB13444]
MRASVAPNRQSQLPGSVSSAAAAAKLLEKKKEFEAVAALERASAQFVKRIEELGDDFDVMADAGIVHGQVLEQWPNMFRILSLFLSQREQRADDENASATTTGERLVRVPIEELRPTNSNAA